MQAFGDHASSYATQFYSGLVNLGGGHCQLKMLRGVEDHQQHWAK